jgi:hypothetical protein
MRGSRLFNELPGFRNPVGYGVLFVLWNFKVASYATVARGNPSGLKKPPSV